MLNLCAKINIWSHHHSVNCFRAWRMESKRAHIHKDIQYLTCKAPPSVDDNLVPRDRSTEAEVNFYTYRWWRKLDGRDKYRNTDVCRCCNHSLTRNFRSSGSSDSGFCMRLSMLSCCWRLILIVRLLSKLCNRSCLVSPLKCKILCNRRGHTCWY